MEMAGQNVLFCRGPSNGKISKGLIDDRADTFPVTYSYLMGLHSVVVSMSCLYIKRVRHGHA